MQCFGLEVFFKDTCACVAHVIKVTHKYFIMAYMLNFASCANVTLVTCNLINKSIPRNMSLA